MSASFKLNSDISFTGASSSFTGSIFTGWFKVSSFSLKSVSVYLAAENPNISEIESRKGLTGLGVKSSFGM